MTISDLSKDAQEVVQKVREGFNLWGVPWKEDVRDSVVEEVQSAFGWWKECLLLPFICPKVSTFFLNVEGERKAAGIQGDESYRYGYHMLAYSIEELVYLNNSCEEDGARAHNYIMVGNDRSGQGIGFMPRRITLPRIPILGLQKEGVMSPDWEDTYLWSWEVELTEMYQRLDAERRLFDLDRLSLGD